MGTDRKEYGYEANSQRAFMAGFAHEILVNAMPFAEGTDSINPLNHMLQSCASETHGVLLPYGLVRGKFPPKCNN